MTKGNGFISIRFVCDLSTGAGSTGETREREKASRFLGDKS
jgi:hypothetical protein